MLKKALLPILVSIMTFVSLQAQIQIDRPQRPVAQEPEEEKWSDRLFVGGGLGVSFFNGWYINVSPYIGYRVTDRFWAGIGLDYFYVSDNFYDFSYSVIGPKAFALYYVIPEVNLGIEASNYFFTGDARERWGSGQTRLLLGGGYTQFFNNRGGIRLELYYDVLYDEDSRSNFFGSALEPRINVFFGL